ncbi:hypothetical protein AB5J49_46975 [Streptomyces sp. R28]|uniref:Uncharacterized protein n=1 Tax=Streptomyces sp. R28 TaxID=3238628 RepID=A0AB39QBK4_9ACTN
MPIVQWVSPKDSAGVPPALLLTRPLAAALLAVVALMTVANAIPR